MHKIWIILILLFAYVMKVAGAKETRTRIAIIDTGVNYILFPELIDYMCQNGHGSFNKKWGIKDNWENQHGTNIANLVVRNLNKKTHCIMILKIFESDKVRPKNVARAVTWAVMRAMYFKASFINLSINGGDLNFLEGVMIKKAIAKKIKISISAGNDALNLDEECGMFPTCLKLDPKYFHVVGSSDGHYSNYGKVVKHWESGTNVGIPPLMGTSQATAIHTNKWARGIVK